MSSQIDFSDAYLLEELDDSKRLCNINTQGCFKIPALDIWGQISTGYLPGIHLKYFRMTTFLNRLSGQCCNEPQLGQSQAPLTCRIRQNKRLRVSHASREVILPSVNKVPRIHRRQRRIPPGPSKGHCRNRVACTHRNHYTPYLPWAGQLLPVFLP